MICLFLFSGCGPATPDEVAVPWDNFASDGWHPVDPADYGGCGTGVEKLGEAEATQMQLAFNIEGGVLFATYCNQEIESADWSDRQAIIMDVDNQAAIPLGITLLLSNDETEHVWHRSVRHPLPASAKKTVRFELRPAPKGEAAPKDWGEDVWRFIKLDLTDVKRVAIAVHAAEGTDGVEGKVVVSNPRFMKLASAK